MEIKTWGQALEYTFNTRHSWRHGNGRNTARINSNHFTEAVGLSFPVRKIDQPLLARVAIDLEDAGKSDATINRVTSAVSTVLNHCAFDGLIPQPPKFRRRKEEEHRINFFTKVDVDKLVNVSEGMFHRFDLSDIIKVAAFTGMRQGELLKLRARDVELHTNHIHVGGVPTQKTKASNWRKIPIHNHIAHIINQRLDGTPPDVRIFGDEWSDKDTLLRCFSKVRKNSGFSDEYVFHTLRHSFATWAVDAGVPMRQLMALMGHKRIETTLRYAKVSDPALTAAIGAI